jgi:predicted nucleotidyltransferase
VELADSLEELLDERVDIAPVALLKPAVAKRALAEAVPL